MTTISPSIAPNFNGKLTLTAESKRFLGGDKAEQELTTMVKKIRPNVTIDVYQAGSINQVEGLSFKIEDIGTANYANQANGVYEENIGETIPGSIAQWDDMFPRERNIQAGTEALERTKTVLKKIAGWGGLNDLLTNAFTPKKYDL